MIHTQHERFTLHQGDNRDVLKELPDNSIDSIVTDPPYELGFMGKSWDASGIAFNVEVWQECLRVLKPGGHLLAFSGSRTYHRMAVAIEDAGFEIRDQIMWIYGSGFPKSLDISKAIDKRGGSIPSQNDFGKFLQDAKSKTKLTIADINEALGRRTSNLWSHFVGNIQPLLPTFEQYAKLKEILQFDNSWDYLFIDEAEREVVGSKLSGIANKEEGQRHTIGASKAVEVDVTIPSTDAARQWQGWGTALKPAHEPIVVARKPLIGTVAANVLTYGTGGLNIDGGRVDYVDENDGGDWSRFAGHQPSGGDFQKVSINKDKENQNERVDNGKQSGRWPANVIHDGSDEVVEFFGEPQRFFYCAKASKRDRNEGLDGFDEVVAGGMQGRQDGSMGSITMNKNHHPTVKPTALMQYLCKLVTPPGGVVLDPFVGSGSTGKAAMYEGFNFVGIELTEEYLPIAKARIEFALGDKNA